MVSAEIRGMVPREPVREFQPTYTLSQNRHPEDRGVWSSRIGRKREDAVRHAVGLRARGLGTLMSQLRLAGLVSRERLVKGAIEMAPCDLPALRTR